MPGPTGIWARRVVAGAGVLVMVSALAGCRLRWTVEPLTADVDGPGSNDGTSGGARFSADGTKVVFGSEANDFGPDDRNGVSDVYIHDLATSTTSLVSVNTLGNAGSGYASEADISADGTKVVFASSSTDLGPPDGAPSVDVYMRDLVAGTTTMLSRNRSGTDSGNGLWGQSRDPVFSPDGTKVAFVSSGYLFGPRDPGERGQDDVDVLLHDLATGRTALVSVNAAGDNGGNGSSESPVFAPDGSAVYFVSRATDLGPANPYARAEIFRYDIATGDVTLMTTNVGGEAMAGWVAGSPVVSPDGRWLAFATDAADLGPTDTNRVRDLYARNLATGEMTLVTAKADGTDASSGANTVDDFDPEFDSTGTRLVFTTESSDLGPTDTNGQRDIYLHDFTAGEKVLVSVNAAGNDSAETVSLGGTFGRGGELVAFGSLAGDLGPRDDNDGWDIYVRDLKTGLTSIVSPTPNVAAAPHGNTYTGCLCGIYGFSPDGHRLLFSTYFSEVFIGDGIDDD